MGVVTALLAFPSTSGLCDLIQGNFSICFKSKHSFVSCPWSLWKWQYLFLLHLLGSPFIFSDHFKEGSSLICINTCSSGMFKGVYCWLRVEEFRRVCLLVVLIFLLSRLCLLWTRTLLRMVREICFHLLSFLPLLSYNCVFCHEVLGWMDEFNHGLRLLLIKLMDE